MTYIQYYGRTVYIIKAISRTPSILLHINAVWVEGDRELRLPKLTLACAGAVTFLRPGDPLKVLVSELAASNFWAPAFMYFFLPFFTMEPPTVQVVLQACNYIIHDNTWPISRVRQFTICWRFVFRHDPSKQLDTCEPALKTFECNLISYQLFIPFVIIKTNCR